MTVSTTASRTVQLGDGANTVWTYSFKIPSASYLQVAVTNSAGNTTVLSSSQYSVTGIGTNSGTVTYPLSGSPLPVGSTISIRRVLPVIQTRDFTNQDPFYPQTVEDALDYLTMLMQSRTDGYDRAIRYPTSDADTIPLEVPASGLRASKLMGWDSTGAPTSYPQNSSTTTLASNIAYTGRGTGADGRTVQEGLRDFVVLDWWTPVADFNGTTGTDNSPMFQEAIDALLANGGGTLYVPRAGKYLVSNTVTADFTGLTDVHIEIVFGAGARLYCPTGFSTNMFAFDDSTDKTQTCSVKLVNPNIDVSRGTYSGAGIASNTSIAAWYLQNLEIVNPKLYGGTVPTNLNADSGVAEIGCLNGVIWGGSIQGFADAGVYLGGDNINTYDGADEGNSFKIIGTHFERNNQDISVKRQKGLTMVDGITSLKSVSGVLSAAVVGPYVGPGRRFVVTNSHFRQFVSNGVRITGTDAKAMIANNVFEDMGIDYTGSAVAGPTICYGIVLLGAQNVEVKNNEFYTKVFAQTTRQWAVQLANTTLDGVLQVQGGHKFIGNTYRDLAGAYNESASGTASTYTGETFDNVTSMRNSTFHADSIVTYTEAGTTDVKYARGASTTTAMNMTKQFASVSQSLAALGVLASGASANTGSITVTGAAVGDEVVVVRETANLGGAAYIVIAARATANTVVVTFRNESGSGFDFAAETIRVIVRRNG